MKHLETVALKAVVVPLSLMILAAGCATTTTATPPAAIRTADYAVPAVDSEEAVKAVKKLTNYRFGDSRVPVANIEDLVRQSLQSPDSRALMAAMLAGVLEGSATVDGKRIACRQLSLIGSEAQLPQLAPLLTDATLSDSARYALERIPGEAVNRALIRALSATSGTIRNGIINTLGMRGASSARAELRVLRNNPDPATAEAARAALDRI